MRSTSEELTRMNYSENSIIYVKYLKIVLFLLSFTYQPFIRVTVPSSFYVFFTIQLTNKLVN